ncbi:MAG TPA: hypothetical protein PLE74_00905 [Candidatus Cloacimonadota bacterium]|nr:hypothetical protein [Candidatus Cloacimonadota bacterium]
MTPVVDIFLKKLGISLVCHDHAEFASLANFKGYYVNPAALPTPGQAGWFAIVGSTDTMWVWDTGTATWLDTSMQSGVLSFGPMGAPRMGNVYPAANDYTWAMIDKTTSSIADIATRSAGDLSSGNLNVARMPVSGTWNVTGDLTIENALASATTVKLNSTNVTAQALAFQMVNTVATGVEFYLGASGVATIRRIGGLNLIQISSGISYNGLLFGSGVIDFNFGHQDLDFNISAATAGINAYKYDAGLDLHTFSTFPVGPSAAPTTDYQFANKKYVDDAIVPENLWDRATTVLSAHNTGDTIDPLAMPVGGTWSTVTSSHRMIGPKDNSTFTFLTLEDTAATFNHIGIIFGADNLGGIINIYRGNSSTQGIVMNGGSSTSFYNGSSGGFGIGTLGTSQDRLKVKGRTSDDQVDAFHVTNSSDTDLFRVRNDGQVTVAGNVVSVVGHSHATSDLISGNLDIARMPLSGDWALNSTLDISGAVVRFIYGDIQVADSIRHYMAGTPDTNTRLKFQRGFIQLEANGKVIASFDGNTAGAFANYFNKDAQDMDFLIYKKTSGIAYNYDAGTDVHTFGTFPIGPTASPTTDYQLVNKLYVDGLIAAANALVYKGVIDCAASPNYPAADCGHLYVVSVAGKIGGSSGTIVEVGDMMICNTDGTASGDQATVGSKWNLVQRNVDSIVSGPTSAVDGNFASFNGATGSILKDSGYSFSSFSLTGHTHATTDIVSGNMDVARMTLGGTWSITSKLTISGHFVEITNGFANQLSVLGSASAGLAELIVSSNRGTSRGTFIRMCGATYAGSSFIKDLAGNAIAESEAVVLGNTNDANKPMYFATNDRAVTCIYNSCFGVGLFNTATRPTIGFETRGVNSVFNTGAGDFDFTIKKNTAGNAYAYDAGLDSHAFNGAAYTLYRNSENQPIASRRTLSAAPTPTSTGKDGERGYYGGYNYIWVADNVVIRHVVETTW